MATRQLTDAETTTITNALRVAADTYDDDAESFRPVQNEDGKLWQQFAKQAIEARALADRMERAETIVVE